MFNYSLKSGVAVYRQIIGRVKYQAFSVALCDGDPLPSIRELIQQPCINKGIGPATNSSVPTIDIDGDPRSGASCDIGADEYYAPTWIRDWNYY